MLARSSLALVVALGVTGCAIAPYSSQPANSARVTSTSGRIYKNGKEYKDVTDAVADNPRALEEARRAHSIERTGTWLALGSVAVGVAGSVTLITNELATNEDKTTKITAQSLLAGAIVGGIVGLCVSATAVPHWRNAVKIYNDDVDAKMRVKRPAPAPAGAPATPTAEPR